MAITGKAAWRDAAKGGSGNLRELGYCTDDPLSRATPGPSGGEFAPSKLNQTGWARTGESGCKNEPAGVQ